MPGGRIQRNGTGTATVNLRGLGDEVEKLNREEVAGMSDEEVLDAFHEMGVDWAMVLAEAGEIDRAIELMESIQYSPATWAERESTAPMVLAALYQNAGRDEQAVPVLEGVVAHLEAEVASGIRHPNSLALLANAYALQDRNDYAIDMLERAVDYHWRMSCTPSDSEKMIVFITDYLLPDSGDSSPSTRLRYDPRIVAMCDRIEVDLEQQANRIRGMLAEHDVDELLAPLMAMAEDGS